MRRVDVVMKGWMREWKERGKVRILRERRLANLGSKDALKELGWMEGRG